jgi:anti-sigma B factor antagonist
MERKPHLNLTDKGLMDVAQLNPLFTLEGNKAVFKPAEDITASNAAGLRESLKTLVNEGVRTLVFDLENVKVIDSTGFGLIVAVHNSLARLDGELTVVQASRDLLELFKTFRLDKHFKVSGVVEQD